MQRPQRAARTNDVEARQARRILGEVWVKPGHGPNRLAVAAAEQKDKARQVLAQLVDAVGGMADELFQRCGETGGVAGQPAAEELHISASSAASTASSLIRAWGYRLLGWVA